MRSNCGRRSEDLDQRRGMDHGVAAGQGADQAEPVGDVAGSELDTRGEALARRAAAHQEAQLVTLREIGNDATAEKAGATGDEDLHVEPGLYRGKAKELSA